MDTTDKELRKAIHDLLGFAESWLPLLDDPTSEKVRETVIRNIEAIRRALTGD